MFAAFLGGWEILLILAAALMMGLGLLVGVGAIVVLHYRQQTKSAPQLSTERRTGQ